MSYGKVPNGVDPMLSSVNRGKREYDLVIIFPNKPNSKIRFREKEEQEHASLEKAKAEEWDKMIQWETKRNVMLKTMCNAGLSVFPFYSQNRQNIICKIGVEVEKLQLLAEQKKQSIQLKDEYLAAYAEYKQDYMDPSGQLCAFAHLYRDGDEENPGPTSMFRTVDRVQLIDYCLRSHAKECCGLDLNHAKNIGDIESYFPLHEEEQKRQLIGAHWWACFIFGTEITKVRDYFGEKIAFYFLWMITLTRGLLIIGAVGLVISILDWLQQTPDNFIAVPFSLFVCIWCALFVHFWRRESATYSLQWGTLGIKDEFEDSRPEFHGEKRINPVTERVDFYYPWSKRIWHVLFSFSVIIASMVTLLFVVLFLFLFRHAMHNQGIAAMPLLFMIINAGVVEVLNDFIVVVARQLTDWENHRTEWEYDSYLIAKTVLFKFFNSYISLYYIAFFKGHRALFGVEMVCLADDCMLDLEAQLAIFIIFRLVVANFVEKVRPLVVKWVRQLKAQVGHLSVKEKYEFFLHAGQADLSVAEMESKELDYQPFDDIDEVAITYGYTVLFCAVCPWAPALVIIANIVEIWLDSTKLIKDMQRPFPVRVRNQEPWDTVFDLFSVIAIFTNMAVIIFSSKELESWTLNEKVVTFLVLEHIVFGIRFIVKCIYPEIPTKVNVLDLKHQHIVRKYIDRIEVEDHDLKRHAHARRDSGDEAFFEIYDRDDEEDMD